MKQRSLLMLLPFALIVTGCGSSLNKGSIFTEKFMKRNFGAETSVKYEYSEPVVTNVNFGEGVVPQVQTDLIKLKKDEVEGYYNILTNSYPIPLSMGLSSVGTSSGAKSRIFYGTKKVDKQEVTFVFDDFGNKLYEGPKIVPSISDEVIPLLSVKENERYKATLKDSGGNIAVIYYNVDGTLKEIVSMQEFYERNPYYEYGESMLDYGHPDIYMNEYEVDDEIRYTTFDAKKGKFTASFVIPEAANGNVFKIGDRIIYQITEQLPDRAEKYDYSDGEDKFLVNTYSVNYLNGSVKAIKTNIVFGGAVITKSLFNEKNVRKLMAFQSIRNIDKDKVLSPVTREVILDENLKEIADVTSVQFIDLAPFANTEYYVNPQGIIFDGKLQEVGIKRGEQVGTRYKTHVVKESTGYGLVNHKGEYIFKPVSGSPEELVDNYFYCLNTAESWKLVTINENEELTVTRDVLKEVFSEGASAAITSFGKYKSFKRKNDSKMFLFDVTTGSEIETPLKPEGSVTLVNNSLITGGRQLSTLKARFSLFEKDGTFTSVRLTEKSIVEYSSIK